MIGEYVVEVGCGVAEACCSVFDGFVVVDFEELFMEVFIELIWVGHFFREVEYISFKDISHYLN
jgi:hypothetical protein